MNTGGQTVLAALLFPLLLGASWEEPLLGPPSPDATDVPVVLVPGWSEEEHDLTRMRERFIEAGWAENAVVAVGFDDPVGSNVDHASELAEAARRLMDATGALEVDVVAHSMGGLATRYWMTRDDAPVRRVVFLATPHRGTLMSLVAWGAGAKEMRPGSEFLLSLGGLRGIPLDVEGLTIRSKTDFHIIPNTSATLPEVPDIELCCPTHAGLLDDEVVFERILSFLERP